MKQIYIEEILRINNQMSFWNLIYKHYKVSWLIIGFLPAIVGFILLSFLFFPFFGNYRFYLIIPALLLGVLSVRYLIKTTQKVIIKKYKYALKKKEKWNYKTIIQIRKKEFKKLIKNKGDLKQKNILFLIESLDREKNVFKYKYFFLMNTLIILISNYIAYFLGGIIKFSVDFSEFLKVSKIVGGIILITITLVIYLEKVVLRELFLAKKNKENRLIRILENIYLEKVKK